jgi:hypothetical protein
MKTAQDTLFDHYQVDTNGAPVLEDSDIFAAMDEHALNVATEFLIWYTPGISSRTECKRVIDGFMSSEYFKELTK